MTVVELDVEGMRSHLVREGGQVAGWSPGPCAHADMRLCWTTADAIRLAQTALSGTGAMAATRIVDAQAAAPGTSLPPLGFVRDAQIVAVREMFGASLRAQFSTTDGPFGPFAFVLDLVEGIPSRERFAAVDAADVVVTLPYQAIASVFADRISVLEAVAAGQLAGELGALAALAGVFEGDEFRALMARSAPRALALAALGDLRTSPEFVSALAYVIATTAPA